MSVPVVPQASICDSRIRLRDAFGEMHEGFVLSQRISPKFGLEELHQLNRPVLLDWQWVESMNLSVRPDDEVKAIHNQDEEAVNATRLEV